MNTYDLNLILAPGLNETQLQTEKDAVATQIGRAGGEIVETDEWGVKRLAYEIRKGREGYYIIYKLKLPGEAPKTIESALRQRDNVMRVLSVRHRPEWRTSKAKPEEAPKPQAARSEAPQRASEPAAPAEKAEKASAPAAETPAEVKPAEAEPAERAPDDKPADAAVDTAKADAEQTDTEKADTEKDAAAT